MAHKIVKLKPGANYTGTTVPFERSLSQIQALLEKFGCDRIITHKDMRGTVAVTTLAFQKAGVPYIIEFPIIYETRKRDPDKLRMDISGRIIHDRIKALLIEVELNILDFSQGMMPFLMIPDGSGNPQMLQDFVAENKDGFSKSSFDIRYILPEKTGGDGA